MILKEHDPAHPGYARWLCSREVAFMTTASLLHAMVAREVRAEYHRIWLSGRCNAPAAYTDDVDRVLQDAIIDALEERINR